MTDGAKVSTGAISMVDVGVDEEDNASAGVEMVAVGVWLSDVGIWTTGAVSAAGVVLASAPTVGVVAEVEGSTKDVVSGVMADVELGVDSGVGVVVEVAEDDVETTEGKVPYRFMRLEPPQNSPGAPLQT